MYIVSKYLSTYMRLFLTLISVCCFSWSCNFSIILVQEKKINSIFHYFGGFVWRIFFTFVSKNFLHKTWMKCGLGLKSAMFRFSIKTSDSALLTKPQRAEKKWRAAKWRRRRDREQEIGENWAKNPPKIGAGEKYGNREVKSLAR